MSPHPIKLLRGPADVLATVRSFNAQIRREELRRPEGTEDWMLVSSQSGQHPDTSVTWEFNVFYCPDSELFHWLGVVRDTTPSEPALWADAAQTSASFQRGSVMSLLHSAVSFEKHTGQKHFGSLVAGVANTFSYEDAQKELVRAKAEWSAQNPIDWAGLYAAEAATHEMAHFSSTGPDQVGLTDYTGFLCSCGHKEGLNTISVLELVQAFSTHQVSAVGATMAELIREVTGF